jgi:Ca2+/Na+ antiporter
MAVSNSIGSNTFDILVALGVPWMIRALITGFQEEKWYVQVQSEALAYTVISLLISLIVLYAILLASRFVLSRTLGVVCLLIYAVFLTISLLFELNVFYPVNLPTCPSVSLPTS